MSKSDDVKISLNVLAFYFENNSLCFSTFERGCLFLERFNFTDDLKEHTVRLAKSLKNAELAEPFDEKEVTKYIEFLDSFIELNDVKER